jgi:hypothetical protein
MKKSVLVCLLCAFTGAEAVPLAQSTSGVRPIQRKRDPRTDEDISQVTINSAYLRLGVAFSCSKGKPLFLIAPIEGRFAGRVVRVDFRFETRPIETFEFQTSASGDGGYIYGDESETIRDAMVTATVMRVRADSTDGVLYDEFDLAGLDRELRELSCLAAPPSL